MHIDRKFGIGGSDCTCWFVILMQTYNILTPEKKSESTSVEQNFGLIYFGQNILIGSEESEIFQIDL